MSSRSDLDGAAILLTGATGGIGEATARELDRRGARLALVDLDAERLGALCSGLRDAMPLAADVTDADAISGAVDAACERFGGIDAAVANAGIAPLGVLRRQDPEAVARVIEVNLLGVYRTIASALPALTDRRGYALAVSSLGAPVPAPLTGAYNSSKAGVEALARSWRIEMAQHGVGIGVAYFGWIDTPMVRGAMADPAAVALRRQARGPLARDYPPEGAAAAVADGIERRARTVAYPRWVHAILAARGLLGAPFERLTRAGADEAVRIAEWGPEPR